MSEQTAETTEPAGTPESEASAAQQLPADHPLVKTLAEQKKVIKDLKARASRLDEIEEAQKSEAEKAAERMAQAEQRAAEAEARALRREIALDHKLDKDDAALLDALTDEDAMRRLAARLGAASEDKRRSNNVSPREGTNPRSQPDEKAAFARSLFAGSDDGS